MKIKDLILKYIKFKQSLGLGFQADSTILKAFCNLMGDIEIEEVKSERVYSYIMGEGTITSYCHRKYSAIRCFYRYAISRGYINKSPLPDKIPKCSKNFIAYIYTDEEFRDLLKATEILDYKKRFHIGGNTFRILLFLLFNTGLRIGEAIFLKYSDVDLNANILTIRDTKFFKSRLVPVDPRLGKILQDYTNWRKNLPLFKNTYSFFVKRNGAPLNYGCVSRTFRMLCTHTGIPKENRLAHRPRIHDIRHTFIISRLLQWYGNGEDVQLFLPYLATYVGHVSMASIQRYLKITPELLQKANNLFEKYVFQEVNNV